MTAGHSGMLMERSSPPASLGEAAVPAFPRRSVWVVALDYEYGWDHGGHLRVFALAREWMSRGCAVHFLAVRRQQSDRETGERYLSQLHDEGIISGFDQIDLVHSRVRGKLARAAVFPAAQDYLLRGERSAMQAEIDDVLSRVSPDVVVFETRALLHALPQVRRYAPVLVDWSDSYALYHRRLLGRAVRRRDLRLALHSWWGLVESGAVERHYARLATANVAISPADAETIRQLAGPGVAVQVVPNGIRAARDEQPPPPVPGRVVFSGNMNFPPNHHSALWFIEHVLPRVVARRPDVRFVVAGGNPLPEMRALAGPHVEVTGWVEDMRAEIARSALYVAPMTAGSGFKNKVIEALAAGRNVVGTPFAFEFLPDKLRASFTATDDPQRLADAVVTALDDPAGNAENVERFWRLARDEFSWAKIAERFAAAAAPRTEPAPHA